MVRRHTALKFALLIISTGISFLAGMSVVAFRRFPYYHAKFVKRKLTGEYLDRNEREYTLDVISKIDGGSMVDIHTIDVDETAHAYLIQVKGGKTALLGCGPKIKSHLVSDYLKNVGVNKIDLLFVTLYAKDHYGAISDLKTEFEIDKVLLPEYTIKEHAIDAVDSMIKDVNSEIATPGDSIDLGNQVMVNILSPMKQYTHQNSKARKPNRNNSLVCKLITSETQVLFMSDAVIDAEEDLLESEYVLESDILHVGHHGKDGSCTVDFVKEVNPSDAIINVAGNRYAGTRPSHKDEDQLLVTIDKLQKLTNTNVLRSDTEGSIVLQLYSNNHYEFKTSYPFLSVDTPDAYHKMRER